MAQHIAVAREHVVASIVVGLVVIVVSFASGLGIIYRAPASQVLTQPQEPTAPQPSLSTPLRAPVNYVGVGSPDPAPVYSDTAGAPTDRVVRVHAVRRSPLSRPHPTATPSKTASSSPVVAPCPTASGSILDAILGTQPLGLPLLSVGSGALQVDPLLAVLLGQPAASSAVPTESAPSATPSQGAADPMASTDAAPTSCAGPAS